MAAVTASHFVSQSSHSIGGVFGCEPRAFQSGRVSCLGNQATAYHGLRPLNRLDMLQMKTKAKTTSRRRLTPQNRRPLMVVVCANGMNMVLVAAEVGPWSKTGGLGDVLGGLPPALAVSLYDSLNLLFFFLGYRWFADHCGLIFF